MLKELYDNSTPYEEWMIPVPTWLHRLDIVAMLAFAITIMISSSSVRLIWLPMVSWVITLFGVLGFGYMVWWRWISRDGRANLQHHYTTTMVIVASFIITPASTALSFDWITMPCGCFGGLFILSLLLTLWDN